MLIRRRSVLLLGLLSAPTAGLLVAAACSATQNAASGEPPSTGGAAGNGVASTSTGVGGISFVNDGGPEADVPVNPCGTACGPTELCDEAHLGLDDNCNGLVDEGCTCSGGQAHFCFKGDPSYHDAPGCHDGTEYCSENGLWGDCFGGVHATDNCFLNDKTNCHAISTAPFVKVHLKEGTGSFSANAVLGTESWTVKCPTGVSPCPGVMGLNPPDYFQPLQSGEYIVTYTKAIADGGTDSCTYPLFVGAPGLRVELSWEHTPADQGVDLDLHMHEPMKTTPWSINGAPQDCGWGNCKVDSFVSPSTTAPHWFSDSAVVPDAVNWYLDPTMEKNTCYYAPRGIGSKWQAYNLGCHNPRLDLDNITCDVTIADPDSPSFCAPENINIDFPPAQQWIRIGVHYYTNNGLSYDVHPTVKVYCDGALGAELGPKGFYTPEAPVTFVAADGANTLQTNRFWLVADVLFQKDQCHRGCVVEPLYSDPVSKTPSFTVDSAAQMSFGPAYPPVP